SERSQARRSPTIPRHMTSAKRRETSSASSRYVRCFVLWLIVQIGFNRTRLHLQSHAASLRIADGSFVDHLDPGGVECRDQLDQRIDIASNHRFARLHSLDGGHGEAAECCEPALIYAEK